MSGAGVPAPPPIHHQDARCCGPPQLLPLSVKTKKPLPWVAPKPVPVMVTCWPGEAVEGLTELMVAPQVTGVGTGELLDAGSPEEGAGVPVEALCAPMRLTAR